MTIRALCDFIFFFFSNIQYDNKRNFWERQKSNHTYDKRLNLAKPYIIFIRCVISRTFAHTSSFQHPITLLQIFFIKKNYFKDKSVFENN